MTTPRTNATPTGARRSERTPTMPIESYNSPKTRHTDENASTVFAAFLFVATLLVALAVAVLVRGALDIWSLVAALGVAVLVIFTVRIDTQWENAVILRFGKYARTAGPGIYLTIPFIEHVALRADQRVMITGFSAEETLTADLVPVNVDAVVFWMVWDAQKACMEVEDYYDSVALAAQTALRDAIGRNAISDVATRRVQLDEELRRAIEEKTANWGVSILSVEIRDVVIPKELQNHMAAEAIAEQRKNARIALAEVEKDVAAMLHEASGIYQDDEIALRLRTMHLLNENVNEGRSTVVVPSSYAEGFAGEAAPRPGAKAQ